MKILLVKEGWAIGFLLLATNALCQTNYMLAERNARFALKMYRAISKENKNKNIFFSPFSISLALGMTYLGARGSTATEMKRVMKLKGLKNLEIHQGLGNISAEMTGATDSYTLDIANRLYADKTFHTLKSFTQKTAGYYKAKLGKVDFMNQAEKVTNQINDWVKQNTGGTIDNLIPQPLSAGTKLVLVNAIYFQGNWEDDFDPKKTKSENFWLNNKEKVKVDMMTHGEELTFRYGEYDDFKVLQIPYKDLAVAMYVFLPKKRNGLAALEKKITAKQLYQPELNMFMPPRITTVKLPKFTIELPVGLKDIFENIGMKKMFTSEADFSGITGNKGLRVSGARHKAFIDVSESGTIAGAASYVYTYYSEEGSDRKEFIADRPFMFMIRDIKTRSVLFMGRVVKP